MDMLQQKECGKFRDVCGRNNVAFSLEVPDDVELSSCDVCKAIQVFLLGVEKTKLAVHKPA